MRSTRRATGSGEVAARGGGNSAPRATARRYYRDRNPFQATKSRTSTTRIKAAWRSRDEWKSWMIVELPAPGARPTDAGLDEELVWADVQRQF